MRTMTKINWVRQQDRDDQGYLRLTTHTGGRGNWTFRIETPSGGSPKLHGVHPDGRRVTSIHATVLQAKDAALDAMHPGEAMGWVSQTGLVLYRATWDDLSFVVYSTGDRPGLWFQYGDATGFRSEPVEVAGLREAREMARAVLRQRYPSQSPAAQAQAAGDTLTALRRALDVAGIEYTTVQLSAAAAELAAGTA